MATVPKTTLQVGDKAPPFKLEADGGGEVSLSGLKGKTVVLYFYPKDDTSGCTAEAIAFSKDAKAFKQAGAVVIGVSKDSVASHDNFKRKHDLAFPLASDQSGDVVAAFGTWIEKSMYGKKYMGIDRATFLVGADGKVVKAWRGVKVPGHVEEVLQAARTVTS